MRRQVEEINRRKENVRYGCKAKREGKNLIIKSVKERWVTECDCAGSIGDKGEYPVLYHDSYE